MPEIGGVGGKPVDPRTQNQVGDEGLPPVDRSTTQTSQQPVGQPGPLGQPVGLPVPGVPGQGQLLPDVLAGRDATQLAAAEQMRARGGSSAIDELLGLNRQPTMAGALPAPPGNSEALRHMAPTMRRTVMRNLLDKQRERMRALAFIVRREQRGGGGGDAAEDETGADEGQRETPDGEKILALSTLDDRHMARARDELGRAARMLDLLGELLVMQDYAISQTGTFSKG